MSFLPFALLPCLFPKKRFFDADHPFPPKRLLNRRKVLKSDSHSFCLSSRARHSEISTSRFRIMASSYIQSSPRAKTNRFSITFCFISAFKFSSTVNICWRMFSIADSSSDWASAFAVCRAVSLQVHIHKKRYYNT